MSLEDRSFITEEQADAYWEGRDGAWDSFGDKPSRLIRASEYILHAYEWKQTPVIGEEVDDKLKDAVAYLAFYADKELDPPASRGGDIRRVQAGPVQVEWNPNAVTGISFRYVEKLLKDLIVSNKTMRLA